MATQTSATRPEQDLVRDKIRRVQDLYADAPEVGRAALARGLGTFSKELTAETRAQSAGRIGSRQGKVSELTAIIALVPGGGRRLRGLLELLGGNFRGADLVGTVHDMRFVFLENDSKLLFATAYDGEWDAYIDDFATKIPDAMDILFCNFAGYPGIQSPKVKDWIVGYQIAASAWYVASPNLTVT